MGSLGRYGWGLCVATVALGGCGPKVGSDEHESASEASTQTGGTVGTGAPTTATTTPATSTSTTNTSWTTSETTTWATGSGTQSGTDGLVCEPGPVDGEIGCAMGGPATASFIIPEIGDFDGGFEGSCVIVDAIDDGQTQTFVLNCPLAVTQPLTLEITTMDPHRMVYLSKGQEVSIDYVVALEGEAYPDRYLAVRDTGGTLWFAGIDAAYLPQDQVDMNELELRLPQSSCDSHESEDCVVVQNTALEVTYDESTALFYGGDAGSVGSFSLMEVNVQQAERIVCWPDNCGINYNTWAVRAVFVTSPGG